MSTSDLGPLVRQWGLRTAQLPAANASPDELKPFLAAVLREAIPFINGAAPKKKKAAPDHKLWKLKGTHAHADSAAKIEVLERVVLSTELDKAAAAVNEEKEGKKRKVRGETWCCRRSVHANAREKGTADWDEFEKSFREEHAKSEKSFTPACLAARQAVAWDCAGVEVTVEEEKGEEGSGLAWGGFGLMVLEMRHRIGKPVLKDRTFPVLQMTCGAVGKKEFVVVSIPVPDFGTASEASVLAKEKDALIGVYVSVERIRILDAEDSDEDAGKIEWLMATASDAAGALPAWVQNLAAPGVIWKDVPLFLAWIAKERVKRRKESGKGKEEAVVDGGKKREGKSKEKQGPPQLSKVDNMPTISEYTNGDEGNASESVKISTAA
ncbi:uncharacterized protein GGS25DRAFT_467565 [Hypoxylon fragiforme]|uniref:uncharacterized protein n=1 Tax=Hypoxylon fragiforme TaxID=63214 RepID=UPI0020C5E98D|nr:uncharacterized protein GGS25DRAFT_467565 [Hypoxylon fragiforme]KAI2613524.1 hypothetical protein GGS25DRAFT_467565 [Hypoxylon fragiforme]